MFHPRNSEMILLRERVLYPAQSQLKNALASVPSVKKVFLRNCYRCDESNRSKREKIKTYMDIVMANYVCLWGRGKREMHPNENSDSLRMV